MPKTNPSKPAAKPKKPEPAKPSKPGKSDGWAPGKGGKKPVE
jgi:hypothetical protein